MKKSTLALCVALALGSQAIASTSSSSSLADKAVCPENISALSKEEKEKLPAICLAEEKSWLEENAPWLAAALGLTGSVIALHDMNHGSGHFSVLANPNPDDDNKDIIISLLPSVNTNIGHYLDLAGKPSNVIATGNTLVTNGATGVKIENAQGSGITTEGNIKVDGAGSVGLDVVGSGNIINQNGYNKITNGATGNNITGDRNTVNTNERTEVHGSGSVGNHVTGSDNTVNQNGEQAVTSGGIGSLLDGQSNTVNIKGDTDVKGSGSVGSSIEGDKGKLKLDGDLNVSDGATGAHIKGEDGTVTVTGKVHVTDKDSVGINVTGNNASVITNGGITVKEEGTGIHVTGNNALAAGNGDIYVDGKGSTGIKLEGNEGKISHDGKLVVTNGAAGFDAKGDLADIVTNLTVDVSDQDSLGIGITGNKGKFTNNGDILVTHNATGAAIQGQGNAVTLGGNITVETRPNQAEATLLDGGVAVIVKGEDNKVNITGDVTINTDNPNNLHVSEKYVGSKGVIVEGNNNTVIHDGKVAIKANSLVYTDTTALAVSGEGNSINIKGGIDVSIQGTSNPGALVKIDGKNEVIIGGKSSVFVNTTDTPSTPHVFVVRQGGSLTLNESSTFVFEHDKQSQNFSDSFANIIHVTEGGAFLNKGVIDFSKAKYSRRNIYLSDSATGINQGVINLNSTGGNSDFSASIKANNGAYFLNDVAGVINITSSTASNNDDLWVITASSSDSNVVNAGTINGSGRMHTLAATSATTAYNTGVINIHGGIGDIGDNKDRASGMLAKNNMATAINTGRINISEAGIGMLANGNGASVINRGIISLDIFNSLLDSQEQIYGMVAVNGGTVINDTDGKIIISTAAKDVAKPFYKDDNANSHIINMGQICIGDSCETAEEYNQKPENSWLASAVQGEVLAELNKELTIKDGGLVVLPSETPLLNKGTVKGGDIFLGLNGIPAKENEVLGLENHGIIESNIIASNNAWIVNDGTIFGNVTLNNSVLNNNQDGELNGNINIKNGGVLHNNANISGKIDVSLGNVFNYGTIDGGKINIASGSLFVNDSSGKINVTGASYGTGEHIVVRGAFLNKGEITSTNNFSALYFATGGTFLNEGTVTNNKAGYRVFDANADDVSIHNLASGVIIHDNNNKSGGAIEIRGKGGIAINDGTITVKNDGSKGKNSSGLYVYQNSKAINNGIINLGEKGDDSSTDLVAMQLSSNATDDAVLENNGTINIYAKNSYAFSKLGEQGRIINNGTVMIDAAATGSGIIKQQNFLPSIESGVNIDYNRPTLPDNQPSMNVIEGYTIGTTASGHAGKLTANNAVLKDVTVNTGFAAGTAERSVTFGDVVTGENIQGAGNIRSESVVWNAQGRLNEKGNVDVTMTKNNYADVAGDDSVASVANALDKAYTNNALFNSLNVKTSQELSKALRQISGSQATTAFNDARILSSRFDRLAAEAPEISNGLAFNAISRNDQRAELGNKVRYDMFALKQAFTLDESQTVELGYGIARLNGSGSSQAGDNGLTGGWSQFLSLKHRLSFGEDYSWSNSLRYDRHVLESNRLIRYGDVNKVASAQNRQQYMEYRTEGNKHIQLADGLNLTPSLGLKLRHTVNGNLNERGAGDFNLGLNSSMETAVDSVVGLKLDYTGKDGWSASAKLEGGPNLSYVKSQRTGVLQGAKGVRFNLDDGQKGGGLNGLAEVGMSYSKDNKSLSASAFQWKEDGIQDKGFMLNYNVRF
ncbi:TPA: hypothetical protein KEV31_004638 [Escherichia coli]|nr:hypothetical protein [Escherichia coli]